MLFKKMMQSLVKTATEHCGREMVRGFIVLVVVPIAIFVALISLVGAIFGIIGIFVYALLIITAKILAGILFGSVLVKAVKKTKEYEVTWQSAMIGVIALELVGLVPVLGWVLVFLIFLAAFGSISMAAYQEMWLRR
jgi:hypothetical protein